MTTVDLSKWERLFADLGSTRFPKRVAFATGKAAKYARDTMRESMREVLGADVKGPGGSTARFGRPTGRTISAVEYVPPQISDVRTLSQATSSVYVKGVQGRVGQDQRAYLKYLFGTGINTRRPGDVGMANDRILVPQNRALLLTQKLAVNPYYNGGRQAPGALSRVQARAFDDQADMFGGDRRSQAMREMAATARLQGREGHRDTPTSLAQRMAAARHLHGMGLIDHNLRHNGFDPVAVSRAAKRYAFAEDRRPRWAVFEAADRRTGVPTYFSRPRRVRDPAGGTHQVRMRDGRVASFPNMIPVAPEYGATGPQVGPRVLFYGLREARYRPKLQAPWEAAMAAGADVFHQYLLEEYREAIGRRDAGKSY